MTDHANELRRHARKIPHPQGETPGVMLRAADEIERLAARLEATEEDRARFLVEMGRLCAQCDALRAKIEQMERQEPVAWARKLGMDLPSPGCVTDLKYRPSDMPESAYMPLYALPGAQPAPSVPDGWLRAIDEALVTAHIGVANAHDTYEQAKAKLDNLIGFHVDVATDPAVNGGWKLVPIELTHEKEPTMQDALMKFDPATGEERPYPSHATQWRNWHGIAAWLFDPWTGRRRNAYDVGSDVHGLLIAPAGTLGRDMGGSCAEKNNVAGAQPAPSVPDGFSREDLEAVADGLDGYEKTVNVGNVTGEGDDHLESTTAYAARFIRTMLAATPETKP